MKQACQKINKQVLAIRLWFTAVLHLDLPLVHHVCVAELYSSLP
jgi:hypothetical protein